MEYKLETHLDEVKDYDWLFYAESDDDTADRIIVADNDSINGAAKKWKMSPEAVREIRDALKFMAETLCEAINEDLKEIYEKVDG